uniref:Uncharacterized protein n=1 Tax=Rhizophora mucronata TaxID=61149 RepID=A0A2P2NT79_RHIMU
MSFAEIHFNLHAETTLEDTDIYSSKQRER